MKREITVKLQLLPNMPGCYQMKDIKGNIIYVGKAKDLKKRVNQYFVGAHDFKTTKMVSHIDDFDYIITHTEKEALLLEINLIKKYTPRFNIMFMDDKSYPYLKLNRVDYPSLKIVRETKKDPKAKYFGPYPDVNSARLTMRILNEIYPLRKCRIMPKKVCLYYHLKQCLGPCEFKVEPHIQQTMIDEVTKFLNGDVQLVLKNLQEKLIEASEALAFEKAREYHELMLAINQTIAKQSMELTQLKNADVFNYYLDKDYISIQVLLIRQGKLLQKDLSLVPLYGDYQDEFSSYIMQYYQTHDYPKEILLPKEFKDTVLNDALENRVIYPIKGNKYQLILLAKENAKNHHEMKFETSNRQSEGIDEACKELNQLLKKDIVTIELFDNSNISGQDNVSAMVVFRSGMPQKSLYRHFKLVDRQDDYASMQEVLYRRYFRLLKEGLTFPDLIIVDGGKGQLNIAKSVLESLDLKIDVCGLVKDDKHSTASLMNSDYQLLQINKESQLFFLLTRMQDEVHRFAISYHQKLRTKRMKHSALDDINGVGALRKEKLMQHFKTFSKIKEASIEDLEKVVGKKVAQSIFITIHSE